MSTQRRRVAGISNPNLQRNQTAILNERLKGLPGMLANKEKKSAIERQNAFNSATLANQNRQLSLSAKSQAFEQDKFKKMQKAQKRSDEIAMGTSALGLATRLGGMDKSLGGTVNKVGKIFGGNPGMSTESGLGGLSLTGLASGGLAGFGLANMFGAKKPLKIGASVLGAGLGSMFF